ncbi:MAG: DUF2779 domain-containing protein [Acholeplasmatales bacterium]
MLKVSKTGFMNLIRCRRFAGLHQIYKEKDKAIVCFSENEEDLLVIENEAKKMLYLKSMYDEETDEDLLEEMAIEFEVLKPYYDKIELLSAKAIQDKFTGKLTYSSNTYLQKKFEMEYEGYYFYCYLDGYLDGETNRIFESKATTTNKFFKIEHKKESIFKRDIDNVVMLKRLLGYDEKGLEEKEKRFYNKYSDVGVYVYDLAYQRYVIEHSKEYDSKKEYKYYLAVLNHEYVFDGTYDNNGEAVYDNDIISFIDFTDVTKKMMPLIEEDMKRVVSYLDEMNASPNDLGIHCERKKTRECIFYPVCFKDVPDENSIFTYVYNHHGFTDEKGNKRLPYDLINKENKSHMLDIPTSWLTRENNLIQRAAVESGIPHIDKGKIKVGIDQLKYPIYHLDFESFPCPLPRFKAEKPYQQSLFQFSLHVEYEGKKLDENKDNISYLAPDLTDRREDLVKALVKAIPNDGGSVLVYNQSFEKTRIKELGEMFPKYKDKLDDIANRLFDLMDITKTRSKFYMELGYDETTAKQFNYYSKDLNGSHSIKKVLPSLTDLKYNDLEVQNGVMAYVTYAKYNPLDKESHKKAMQGLIDYCKRDTYSMYIILEALREIVKK